MYEFVVDAMLGDLAKWLRILGRSTFYKATVEDEDVVKIAASCRAVLVTRDRALYERARRMGVEAVYLGRVRLAEALKLLSKRYAIRLEVDLSDSRCPLCNGKLRFASRVEVKDRVPQRVLYSYTTFLVCETCGHVYWPGRHLRNMRAFLRELRSSS